MLNAYIAAEQAVLQRKEYSIGNRKFTSEDLLEIRKGRQEWEEKLNRICTSGDAPKVTRIVPIDD